ncbi:hypothetical protein [Spirosoma rhododendri]|uniref:Uncharacterized protein n=1 Tax=Spirosoma rhododendri TaxID=2728024 RepID=A0A7L5DKV8_9BACT|nr:hypothetical protein [Spirosoma rhododendri]QJD77038.1 hypothetical protein HH216_00350 [Spirosoma rhododendri]
MKAFSLPVLAALSLATVLTSCNRQQALFQRTPAVSYAAPAPAAAPVIAVEQPVVITETTPASADVTTPAAQAAQAKAALTQLDALVSANPSLTGNKRVEKRMSKVRTMLTSLSTTNAAPVATTAPKKMNLVQRMMLKKMDRKISKQLAPANPEKAMISSGTLALGAVLVIVGLLLILLTSGTGSVIGIIALLAGAVVLLLGLL